MATIDPRFINIAIEELPSVIEYLKSLFAKRDPSLPALTDEQVVALFNSAYLASLATDDKWLAAHPEA